MIVEFVDAWVTVVAGAILTVAVAGGLIAAAVAGLTWWLYGRLRPSHAPQAPNQQHAPVRSLTKEKQPA